LADKFDGLDTVVFGVSLDNAASQVKFIARDKLQFSLIADTDKKLSAPLGAVGEGKAYTSRYTYVIDKKGVIRKVYTSVKPAEHAQEVADFIAKELK